MQTPPGTPVRGALSESKRALLEKRMRGEAAGRPSSSAITRRAGDGPAPLSFAQEHLWFMEQMEPGHPRYHLPGAIRLLGPVDPPALERALTEAVRRHESLRTVFPLIDGKPMQVVLPELRVPVPVVDVPEVPGEDREATVARMVREEGSRPFDLEHGPLIRAVLFRLSEREHVLVQVVHHIASDGWSQGLFSREMSALYEHYALGAPAPDLPEPAVRYRDFALWQREYLAGSGAFRRDVEYWKQRLADAPQLELPTDRPRPPVQSGRGAMYRFGFPEPLAEAARALALDAGVSLHMLLVATLSATLLHHTGQDDQVIGSLLGGRGRPETERVVGYFVNLTALRIDLSGDPTFRQLVRRVRDAVLDSDAHQDLPFARIVHEVGAGGDLSRHPVFQVMAFVHNFVRHTVPFPGEDEDVLRAVPMYDDTPVALVDTGTAKFDLSLAFHDIPGSLSGLVEYSTDLFDRDSIVRLVRHYLRALEQVTAAPDTPVADLRVMDDEERRRILEEWAPAPALPVHAGTLHGPFAAQAARTPDATALVWLGREVTYAQLDRRAEEIARTLRRRGVGPESRVGVCLERTPDMVAALLGVLRAGGTYVPLDPAHPRQRLAGTLADSGAALVLASGATEGALADFAGERLLLERDVEGIAPDDRERTDGGAAGENGAYVIYTSGSTGRPKGVVVEHRNAAAFFAAMTERLGGEPARWLGLSSITFDISVVELLWTLTHGSTTVLHAGGEWEEGGESLAELIRGHGVTHLQCTPTRAAILAADTDTFRALAGVRCILLGGEALSEALVEQLRGATSARILNMYGPTETTVWNVAHEVAEAGAVIPIGRPLAGTRAYVLDARMQPVPEGAAGELMIGGAGVARGYLGRPELTADRFVPDPFSGAAGARLYRTGDLARWRTDGVLEFLGRLDRQLKVRGFRIEPGEVESAILRHPGVREAVVEARGDTPASRRLVGYVVPADPASPPTAAGLRDALRGELPEHMIPGAWVVLDSLPRTASGKTDRRALPDPDGSAPDTGRAPVPPRTATEAALAEIWAEVLELDRVGVDHSFFELGGHSLLATQVVSRLRERLGADLPVRAVFEELTVERLARRVDERRDAEPAVAAAPITRRDRGAYRVADGPA
ncbi:MAG TPA: amino acid adenylation domain-containing protein [Longimicrobiaceae bacterium]|jgi:amino acid adenylation domain-containing protein